MALTRVSGDLIGQNTVTNQNIAASVQDAYGWRNRIINGDMRIDQRNAGASVTPTTGQYLLDRWVAFLSQASKFSVQQNAGAVTPPAGFTNYLGITSLSSYAVTTSDAFTINQFIEGFNVADLGWGSAGAQTVTLSFWVRSSLTGTFGGSLRNSDASRSYPYTYSINAANTWEYKTVTIQGDTSGTWLTNNGRGIFCTFGLGNGATVSGTAGAWSGSNFSNATGATSVVGTNGATFYITGVQLEAGSVATAFERRDYGRELALCQRYFEIVQFGGSSKIFGTDSSQWVSEDMRFLVEKRALPTVASVSGSWKWWNGSSQITANFTSYQIKTTTVSASGESGGPGQSNAGVGFAEPVLSASAEL